MRNHLLDGLRGGQKDSSIEYHKALATPSRFTEKHGNYRITVIGCKYDYEFTITDMRTGEQVQHGKVDTTPAQARRQARIALAGYMRRMVRISLADYLRTVKT
jgi:hypothetical protein